MRCCQCDWLISKVLLKDPIIFLQKIRLSINKFYPISESSGGWIKWKAFCSAQDIFYSFIYVIKWYFIAYKHWHTTNILFFIDCVQWRFKVCQSFDMKMKMCWNAYCYQIQAGKKVNFSFGELVWIGMKLWAYFGLIRSEDAFASIWLP